MSSSESVGTSVLELVREHGLKETVTKKLEEFLQSAKSNDSFQKLVQRFEVFENDTLGPAMEKYLSEENARKVRDKMQEYFAKLKAEQTRRHSIVARISKRISVKFPGKPSETVAEYEDITVVEVDDDDDSATEPVVIKEAIVIEEEPDVCVTHDGSMPKLQPAARMQTGFEGNMTKRQEEDLAAFRDIMLGGKYKEDVLKHRDGVDRLLLRFLRAECSKDRTFNLKKSKKRLEETLQWRRDNDIDSLVDNPPPHFEFTKKIMGEYEMVDEEGRLLIFVRTGVLANTLEMKELSTEEWVRYFAALFETRLEKLRQHSKKWGHEISAFQVVYDCRGGFGLAARKFIPFLKLVNSIAAPHYPECIDGLYVAAAPGVFNMLFKILSPMLDPVTRDKFRVYSSSKKDSQRFIKDIHSHVDLNKLPAEYLGKNQIEMPMPHHAAQKNYPKPKPWAAYV